MLRRTLSIASLLALGTPALAQTPDQPPPPPPPDQTEPPAPPAPPTPPTPPPAPEPAPVAAPPPANDDAPLQFKIGSAYITPIGFMDFTGVWRSKNGGSGIGTNFGSIPYNFGPNVALGETRLSMQNSRIGFRVDAPVHESHVIGYMEADFLGNNPGNVAVSSNSNTLRSRLYWVDIRKHELEVLAGQTWSLITPGRSGISPLPGDLSFTQDIDVNYQAGLVWGRIPELRVVYHPIKEVAAAIALDSAEQYVGGSAGGGTITAPASYGALSGTQLDNATTILGVPNMVPDVIGKLAVDPSKKIHLEAGGLERQFKIWNPTNETTSSTTGVGAFVNINVEIVDGLRIVSNNFYSQGGGRYIFGQAPDLIILNDGSLKTVTSESTVSGLELTYGATLLYGYYGGIYIDKAQGEAVAGMPCMDAASCVGYGYPGSPSAQNKMIQEWTAGFNQTFWKDPRYGALNLMGQVSNLTRTPWAVPMGTSANAHLNMVFLNLRYTLPGAPPKLHD